MKRQMPRPRPGRQRHLGMPSDPAVEPVRQKPVKAKIGDDYKSVIRGHDGAMRMRSLLPYRIEPSSGVSRPGDRRPQLAVGEEWKNDERLVWPLRHRSRAVVDCEEIAARAVEVGLRNDASARWLLV